MDKKKLEALYEHRLEQRDSNFALFEPEKAFLEKSTSI
jgi:hypothetical protein